MPEMVRELPKNLRLFQYQVPDFSYTEGNSQARGTCPFCTAEKFYIEVETGLWKCHAGMCGASGNPLQFVEKVWMDSWDATSDYAEIQHNRRILEADTLERWGIARSLTTGHWVVPAFEPNGKFGNLYEYRAGEKGRMSLMPTATIPHKLHWTKDERPKEKPTIYICEGVWDAMALWEVMGAAKLSASGDGTYTHTSNEAISLLSQADVIAANSCTMSLAGKWSGLFAGKNVVLMFDSDHPIERANGTVGRAGYDGMRRITQELANADSPPESIQYLKWGPEGYDPNQKSGYDVRDFLTQGSTILDRIDLLKHLFDKVEAVPADWIAGRSGNAVKRGGTELELLDCYDWKTLRLAWRKAMKWIDGLDRALACMLATILSTESQGDQLWIKVVGPPSCGKSVLCEAISVNRKYVLPKSTIRGLFSGYQTDREGKDDSSLAPRLKNKTLVTKDGDTLLQMPNRSQILAEFRDMYDRVSRTQYRNKMSRDYEGISLTWILCGTESLRELDTSELGERMLDCVIIDKMDEDLENEIALRKAYQADADLSYKSDGRADSRDSPEMVAAKRLTGGYIEYLRENAQDFFSRTPMSHEMKLRCVTLGTFVAFMRSRPSEKQEEVAQRELNIRLVSQLTRLAKCLAVVLNRKEVDEEVMARVRQVALDTARGRTLGLCKILYEKGDRGAGTDALATITCHSREKEWKFLNHLRKLGAVKQFDAKMGEGLGTRKHWRLTPRLRQLCEEVLET